MTKPTSEQVTFLAAGSGASQRTVLDKLRDFVSVKDFGAVGDGVADDTAAFTAAIAAAGTRNVYVPGGSYKITGTVTGDCYSDSAVTIVTGTVNTVNRIGSSLSTTGNLVVGGDITVNGDGLFINPNALINGDFQVAQRGTSFVSTGTFVNNDDSYVLDRWYILSDGNDAIDVTQNTADAPFAGGYCIALDVETVNKKFGIAQIIENQNCNGLLGQTVTLSFKAKVSSTTKLDNVKCAIVAWSGTSNVVTSDIISAWNAEGTNPTLIANATYENTPANLNVTTSWQKFTVTAAVDTASASNIIVFIWSDVTDTTLGDFLYVTDVKLEAGTLATPYPREEFSTSILRCQRYFVSAINAAGLEWHDIGNVYATYAVGGTNFFQRFPYRVPMRAAPTTTIVGTWSASNSNQPVATSVANTLSLLCVATALGAAQTSAITNTGWYSSIEM
jgi:hypothetical protein